MDGAFRHVKVSARGRGSRPGKWRMEVGARDMGGQGLSSARRCEDFSGGTTVVGESFVLVLTKKG